MWLFYSSTLWLGSSFSLNRRDSAGINFLWRLIYCSRIPFYTAVGLAVHIPWKIGGTERKAFEGMPIDVPHSTLHRGINRLRQLGETRRTFLQFFLRARGVNF